MKPSLRHRDGDRVTLAPWQARFAQDLMLEQTHRALPLAEIAARLDISVGHFIRAFRVTVGVTPYQWFLHRRIAQSLVLLRHDSLSLSTIASQCGFADQSHFTKAFAVRLGVSPGRWRRRAEREAARAPVATGDSRALIEGTR